MFLSRIGQSNQKFGLGMPNRNFTLPQAAAAATTAAAAEAARERSESGRQAAEAELARLGAVVSMLETRLREAEESGAAAAEGAVSASSLMKVRHSKP